MSIVPMPILTQYEPDTLRERGPNHPDHLPLSNCVLGADHFHIPPDIVYRCAFKIKVVKGS
ncbi:hypothetical protein J6590_066771 [Homalodisca vitripennis]|nr:hypothetical protein J6590_066771 [Homalodisca vitripennis]